MFFSRSTVTMSMSSLCKYIRIKTRLSVLSNWLDLPQFNTSRLIHSSLPHASVKGDRVVLVSTSEIIFENLALEEWMYENEDLSSREYLLMWINRPAIVAGRHQNPWLEANIPFARSLGVDIARRSSGGGTVYHDHGNLNLSFMKSREKYNRRENLDLVVEAVTSKWDIDLTVNSRDDILLNKLYKVSGTAAKLGRLQSYHHFTLLHSVNQDLLQRCLDSNMQGANSKATKSFPSAVMNLSDQEESINFQSLVDTIGSHFLSDAGQEKSPDLFCQVNPVDESMFPGVTEISNRLQTWEWRFAKSPDFTVKRSFVGHIFSSKQRSLEIDATVKKGMLTSFNINPEPKELTEINASIQDFCDRNINFSLTEQNVADFGNKLQNHFCSGGKCSTQYYDAVMWIRKCIDASFDFL